MFSKHYYPKLPDFTVLFLPPFHWNSLFFFHITQKFNLGKITPDDSGLDEFADKLVCERLLSWNLVGFNQQLFILVKLTEH